MASGYCFTSGIATDSDVSAKVALFYYIGLLSCHFYPYSVALKTSLFVLTRVGILFCCLSFAYSYNKAGKSKLVFLTRLLSYP